MNMHSLSSSRRPEQAPGRIVADSKTTSIINLASPTHKKCVKMAQKVTPDGVGDKTNKPSVIRNATEDNFFRDQPPIVAAAIESNMTMVVFNNDQAAVLLWQSGDLVYMNQQINGGFTDVVDDKDK